MPLEPGHPVMSVSSIITYQKYATSSATLQTTFEKTSNIQKDIDYFKKAVAKAGSVDELFKDYKLLSFLATATNLAGEEQYAGKMRRILTEKVSDSNAVMNRLSDKRYAQAAETLQLAETGVDTLKQSSTQDALIAAYKQAKFETSIGTENIAVRKARYFEKYITSATSSVYNILGDAILRDVVTSTLGLPQQIAVQPVETQAAAITSRLDVTKLNDSKYRDAFIKRYLTQYDIANPDTGASTDWRTSLLGGATADSATSIIMSLYA
ncbi:DUF1217 domain-containing protein [Azospirillum sp.]|uniref:DUF1217 domain-containing protein n=1 Tax=Azospirillum sp. TaxID=34012 RepID=UPI003D711416